MSTENRQEKRGGFRPNSGRKPRPGGTVKICVSVTETIWESAKKRWDKKASVLVDGLLVKYVNNEVTL